VKQKAQLSQRDRAMPHVIEYFTTSLRVTHSFKKTPVPIRLSW